MISIIYSNKHKLQHKSSLERLSCSYNPPPPDGCSHTFTKRRRRRRYFTLPVSPCTCGKQAGRLCGAASMDFSEKWNNLPSGPSLKNLTEGRFGLLGDKQFPPTQDLTKAHIESFDHAVTDGLSRVVQVSHRLLTHAYMSCQYPFSNKAAFSSSSKVTSAYVLFFIFNRRTL